MSRTYLTASATVSSAVTTATALLTAAAGETLHLGNLLADNPGTTAAAVVFSLSNGSVDYPIVRAAVPAGESADLSLLHFFPVPVGFSLKYTASASVSLTVSYIKEA